MTGEFHFMEDIKLFIYRLQLNLNINMKETEGKLQNLKNNVVIFNSQFTENNLSAEGINKDTNYELELKKSSQFRK